MPPRNSMFKKGEIKDADPARRGQYFLPGEHITEIANTLRKESQRQKRDWAIVETRVMHSTAHPRGEERSWLIDLSKKSAPGNIKGFVTQVLFALLGQTPDGSFDIAPFCESDDAEQVRDFKAAIETLGTSLVTVENLDDFGKTFAFEYVANDMFEESKPVGVQMYLRTFQIKTDEDKDFTIHDWLPSNDDLVKKVIEAAAEA